MISLKTPTKSQTSQSLTDEQRDRLIDLVATRYLDGMDLRDLERFFFDIQRDYLQEYTDEELLETVEDVTDEDEYNEVINEIG
jgi:ATP-dependent RNA circularization protein (DNA/RNA ligase family)